MDEETISTSEPAAPAHKRSAIFEPVPQAQINKKLIRRFIIGIVLLGILIGCYTYMRSLNGDIDFPREANTVGFIAAIKYQPNGQQAVLIKPDGTEVTSPGYAEDTSDRDITWRPDGNRVFFSRAPKNTAYQIFRWNPESNSVAQRSITNGGMQPSFPNFTTEGANGLALILRGGLVLDYDPESLASHQVLPPQGKGATQGTGQGEGASGQFEAIYQSLGTSFKTARWVFGKQYIAAVMRNDNGEVLIIQPLSADDSKLMRPQTLAQGAHIDMAVNPHDGSLVFAVMGNQVGLSSAEETPQASTDKNGEKVTVNKIRYKSFLGTIVSQQGKLIPGAILTSEQDNVAFEQPCVSPDGSKVAVVICAYDKTTSTPTPKLLIVTPNQPGSNLLHANVAKGEIYEPSWTPDGNGLVFAMHEGSNRNLYSVNVDGSNLKCLTPKGGNYGYPVYSPQKAK